MAMGNKARQSAQSKIHLNKSQNSPFVKAVLIVLIVVFVAGFIGISAGGLFVGSGSSQAPGTSTAADPLAAANQQFQPTVSSLTNALQSDPTSYTALVDLGNTYYDWAITVQQAAQTSTSAVGADLALWTSAKDAYKRALDVKSTEPAVRIDYSITLFQTGDTNAAVKIAEDTIAQSPDFAPAYFNLGVYYKSLGQNDKVATAWAKAKQLDPKGEKINLKYINDNMPKVTGSSSTSTTP